MNHIPVLLDETLSGLALTPGARCIDGTLGGAGHAEAILQAVTPSGALLGLDLDPAAVERARVRLAPFAQGEAVTLVQASFGRMAEIARSRHFVPVNAIVLDLGLSSHQLGEAGRGFSFLGNGPLDMRMDPDAPLSAGDIVNGWREADLADVIYRFGEETRSRRIARAIVNARPIATTGALADVVTRALGGKAAHQRIHPATRTFQALRIAVNGELETLEQALPQMVELLAPGGRFAVITFHSLEDRIVKQFIRRESTDCLCPPGFPVCQCGHRATLRPVTGKPITPGPAELENNVRSRSAKLRIAERLATK